MNWGSFQSDRVFKCRNGIKQGGILSPLPFKLYLDDLLIILDSTSVGPLVGDNKGTNTMYAGDIALVAMTPKGIQRIKI